MGIVLFAGGNGGGPPAASGVVDLDIGLNSELDASASTVGEAIINLDLGLSDELLAVEEVDPLPGSIFFDSGLYGSLVGEFHPGIADINFNIGLDISARCQQPALEINFDSGFFSQLSISAEKQAGININIAIGAGVETGNNYSASLSVPLLLDSQVKVTKQRECALNFKNLLSQELSCSVQENNSIMLDINFSINISGESAGATGCGSIKCFDEQTRWS